MRGLFRGAACALLLLAPAAAGDEPVDDTDRVVLSSVPETSEGEYASGGMDKCLECHDQVHSAAEVDALPAWAGASD